MEKQKTEQIDFGIGKIKIFVQPGSSLVIDDLIKALSNVAMVVPLQQVVDKINSLHRF